MQNHQLADGLIVSWHPAPLNGDCLRATEDTCFAVVPQEPQFWLWGTGQEGWDAGQVYLVHLVSRKGRQPGRSDGRAERDTELALADYEKID